MRFILKFDLTFAVTDKKINLAKEKDIQNKYYFFVHFWAKKDSLWFYIITPLYAILVGILLVLLLIQIGILYLQCYYAMSCGNPSIHDAY